MSDDMSILKPKALREGATLGIFSPSEPLTETRRQMVKLGAELLQRSGFRVLFANNYEANTYYTAGTIEQRAQDIHDLLSDPSVDALITSWGGKSCCQLLPSLNFKLFRQQRKPVLAFSDGAALINAVASCAQLVAFYGPNVVGKIDTSEYANLRSLFSDILMPGSNLLADADMLTAFKEGTAEGYLVGGNLSTFANSAINTAYSFPLVDWIFLWESGPKTTQELDTLLWSIRLSNNANRIRGMVIGYCEVKDDAKWGNKTLGKIVGDVFGDFDIPIVHAPLFGHTKLPNPIFPIGCRVSLETNPGRLILQESVVED